MLLVPAEGDSEITVQLINAMDFGAGPVSEINVPVVTVTLPGDPPETFYDCDLQIADGGVYLESASMFIPLHNVSSISKA